MANTLTNLIPDIYEALDVVSRERVGFVSAVTTNSSAERAALAQNIRVPVAPATTAEADNTAAVNAPDTGDDTVTNVAMTISKSKHVPVRWNGEETRGLLNAGSYATLNRDRLVQGFRRLTNLIEIDLAGTYANASRAVGTAGTTPFGTINVLTDFSNAMQIMDDNGAPPEDLKMVLGNSAMNNLRGVQATLFRANEAGTDEMLRDGKVARIQGFDIHQSGQVLDHTIGTENAAFVTSATEPIGEVDVPLITGTGTIVAGDFVKNQEVGAVGRFYGVKTGISGAGTITLNEPGLRRAWASGDSIENTSANFSANMVFHKSAIQLITRAPALPEGGDAAEDSVLITDPVSGITYEVALYKQFLQNVLHIRLAWGWKAIKEEHIGVLFG
jgi:hypothetical protein